MNRKKHITQMPPPEDRIKDSPMKNPRHFMLKNNTACLPDSSWKFPLDKSRKAMSLLLIQEEVLHKRIRKRPSFAENIWNQLRFQTWQHWMMHGGILLAAILLTILTDTEHLTGISSVSACSVFLVFAGNICFSSVARLFSYHMAELEKTLYLDLKQMVCIQMLEGGIVNLAALLLLTGFLDTGSDFGITACLLYLLVPFLWSDILYLYMLTHLRSIFPGLRQSANAVLCAILALLPAFIEEAYTQKYLLVWGFLSAAGILFLAAEISQMFHKIEKGESICLN